MENQKKKKIEKNLEPDLNWDLDSNLTRATSKSDECVQRMREGRACGARIVSGFPH